MKTVVVTYQVRPEFVERNAANIGAVMDELRSWSDPSIRYQSFRKADGVTFVHVGMYADAAAQERMTASPAFARFQQELRASEPVKAPSADWLELVGSTYDVFPG